MRRSLLLAAALPLLPLLPASPAAAAPLSTGQTTFAAVEPQRLVDTREGLGAPQRKIPAGGVLDVVVGGVAGVPTGATAVVLNVTATRASEDTDVRVYPTPSSGAAFPVVSNLNVRTGQTASNLVTVAVGAARSVRLRNAAGSVDLLVDVSGWYGPTTAGASYTAVEPRRLLDTRDTDKPFGPAETRLLPVTGGESGAPVGARAVVLNVTAVGATRVSDVRVWPTRAGGEPPEVSSLNPAPGRITPAAVVVGVGDAGTVSLRNAAGTVHLAVDLSGWYVAGTDGLVFRPAQPRRLLDTRSGSALGAGGVRDLVVAGTGQVPFHAGAAVVNVTAVGATSSTDVRAYPKPRSGTGFPHASNVNAGRGDTVPNAVVSAVGRDGSVRFRNAAGSVHLVVDLAGWMVPAGDGWDISWPQCNGRGATTSHHPASGSFAIVGLTRGRPFTDNECFADEFAWASSLPGGAAVYINVDAPGSSHAGWDDPGPRACNGLSSDGGCGWNWGHNLVGYVLERLPVARDGGKPQVFLDVEGPYSSGPQWQTAGVNGNVIIAAINRLRAAGYRVGVYSHETDWNRIVGGLRLTQVQSWTFRHTGDDQASVCAPSSSPTGGDVVFHQTIVEVQQPDGTTRSYDSNRPC